jgi:hypothetical protein
VIELALFGRVVSRGNATQLNLRLLPGGLRSPDAMQADGVASRPAGGSILEEIAALAGDEDAQADSGQVVIPDDVVFFPRLGSVHYPLREFRDRKSPAPNPSLA